LSKLDTFGKSEGRDANLAYLAELHTNQDDGDVDIHDPRVYAAKKKSNPDMPTFKEAMKGEYADEYIEAMKIEVKGLINQNTWKTAPRPVTAKVVKSTWVFKLKRLPDGTPSKFKARFCVRGDLQTEGVEYFEYYALVVQWCTIRMVLALVLREGWATRQVNYTNAFVQAEMAETVPVEPPRLFGPRSGKYLVLLLLKSLYGLKQAPRTFYEKLREGLLERGCVASEIDPCLFMKAGCICIIYVDDTIFSGPEADKLSAEVQSLGVNSDEHQHSFQLRDEGEVGDFLGIRIEKLAGGKFLLTQTGLIEKTLKAAGMIDYRVRTPGSTTPVGADHDGDLFHEDWEYATIVGMLINLSANTRPDLTYAVHQATRHTHAPRASHAAAVKRILRCLSGTRDKGMFFQPNQSNQIDCHGDAEFEGLFVVEDRQESVSVKSRTGYVIFFCGVPLLWVSKLQTQIALSTCEAEYIALSQSMQDLIPIRETLKEIMTVIFEVDLTPACSTYSKSCKDVQAIPTSNVYEENTACLKLSMMPKLSPWTKHIGIPWHWFRAKIIALECTVSAVDSASQLADQYTKGLPQESFERGRKAVMGW
jgi:hypothetical protein